MQNFQSSLLAQTTKFEKTSEVKDLQSTLHHAHFSKKGKQPESDNNLVDWDAKL